MEKTFTINVPDEIWVDCWDNDKTESYNYNGPEKIWVIVGRDSTPRDWSSSILSVEENSGETVVEIDANTDTALAHYFACADEIWTYEYNTETNHDGSTHEAIINPRLHDYFVVDYELSKSLHLQAIIKNHVTVAEEKAISRLEYVKTYDDAYDFDADTQLIIDKFTADINLYLDSMKTVYPWKYVSITENDIPKIPALLVSIFSTLPEIK